MAYIGTAIEVLGKEIDLQRFKIFDLLRKVKFLEGELESAKAENVFNDATIKRYKKDIFYLQIELEALKEPKAEAKEETRNA